MLTPHAQGRPARRQHLKCGTGALQYGNERCGGDQEVLAVIEQQQGLSGVQDPSQLISDRLARHRGKPEGCRHGCGDKHGVGERGQINPDHSVGEGARHLVGKRESEPRLADTAGTGQGQQWHGFVEQERASR
jgi:hypothetical protein